MKIYCGYKSWTRDCRPRWVLEELGMLYEKINLDVFRGEQKAPEYIKLHPLGKIPFLVDGKISIFESGAITAYLAEQYGEDKIIPAKGTSERAEYLQWLFFIAVNVEVPIVKIFANRYINPNRDKAKEMAQEGESELALIAPVLENAMRGKQYLVGNRFSAADIMLGTALVWADKAEALSSYPELSKYLTRLSERPAFRKTFEPTEREFQGYSGPSASK